MRASKTQAVFRFERNNVFEMLLFGPCSNAVEKEMMNNAEDVLGALMKNASSGPFGLQQFTPTAHQSMDFA